ncbi:MAG: hypothetical protein LBM08_14905 [Dysgonamonadaceae bacterium]|jgi:hypothetical protein|nr:hypothetical protein [Dysgonamonadaceae bacterium]
MITPKFLKTYLWTFNTAALVCIICNLLFIDAGHWQIQENNADFHYIPTLTTLAFPAILCLLAFLTAKLLNWKDKLFMFGEISIVSNLLIILLFLSATLLVIKTDEDVSWQELYDYRTSPNFILLLFIGLLAACVLILFKTSVINLKEQLNEFRKKKIGEKFFLIFHLISLLLSLIAIIVGFSGVEAYKSYPDFFQSQNVVAFSFCLISLVSSLTCALFDYLSKIGKAVSLLCLLFFLVVTGGGGILVFALIHNGAFTPHAGVIYNRYDSDDGYSRNKDAIKPLESVIDDKSKATADLMQEETPTSSLAFLWEDENADQDSVEAAIAYAAKEIDLSGFPRKVSRKLFPKAHDKQASTVQGSIAYRLIIEYIRKEKGAPLAALMNTYGHYIRQHLSGEIFQKHGAKRLILSLIMAYDDIFYLSDRKPNDILHDIYATMSEQRLRSLADYFPLISANISESFLSGSIFMDKDKKLDKGLIVWAYSFWARRNNEGRTDDAHKVALDLYTTYIADPDSQSNDQSDSQ